MSVLTDTWRQLVRRRLWPVALLLVVALAAVPVFLTRDPEPVIPAATPPAPAAGDDVLASEPVVQLATAEDRDRRRRVLGARHDIFKPTAKKPKAAKAAKATKAAGETSAPGGGASVAAAPAASGGGAPAPITPAPVREPAPEPEPEPEPAPAKVWPADSVTVRFGDAAAETREKLLLEKLDPMPSREEPVAVYLRLKQDGKTAVFLLDANVQPTGDGSCRPSPSLCETLELRVGETEFLDVVDEAGAIVAQYQLDVVKAHNPTRSGGSATRRITARTAVLTSSFARAARGLGYR